MPSNVVAASRTHLTAYSLAPSQAQALNETVITHLLDSPTLDVSTPKGLQSRLIFYMAIMFCTRASTQLYNMRPEDFKFEQLPASHLEYPGWYRLTYLESHTKTNQGNMKQVLKGKSRENPFVLLDPHRPTSSEALKDCIISLYQLYKSKLPQAPTCSKFFLQPIANAPSVRLFGPLPLTSVIPNVARVWVCNIRVGGRIR